MIEYIHTDIGYINIGDNIFTDLIPILVNIETESLCTIFFPLYWYFPLFIFNAFIDRFIQTITIFCKNNQGQSTLCPRLAPCSSISELYTLSDGALPNTGVTTGLSQEEAFKASISVLTAVRASGCVNKKPSSQNEAGPTLPWKIKRSAFLFWACCEHGSSSCRSHHHVELPIPDACQ